MFKNVNFGGGFGGSRVLCHLVPSSFDDKIYDDMSTDELKKVLMKKDIELTCLKKGYAVKEGGLVPKEFVTFSKKNMK